MYSVFVCLCLLPLLDGQATRVLDWSMFGHFFLEILSGCLIDHKIPFYFSSICSCSFPLLQKYLGYLIPWIVLIDRRRTRDLVLIATTNRSLLFLFQRILNLVPPPFLAWVVSFLDNCQSSFLVPTHFSLTNSSKRLLLLGKQNSLL